MSRITPYINLMWLVSLYKVSGLLTKNDSSDIEVLPDDSNEHSPNSRTIQKEVSVDETPGLCESAWESITSCFGCMEPSAEEDRIYDSRSKRRGYAQPKEEFCFDSKGDVYDTDSAEQDNSTINPNEKTLCIQQQPVRSTMSSE